jgi:hypothetical protein
MAKVKIGLVCDIFDILSMLSIRFGAVGAGATSRCSSGSNKMMQLLAAPALQHWNSLSSNARFFHTDMS